MSRISSVCKFVPIFDHFSVFKQKSPFPRPSNVSFPREPGTFQTQTRPSIDRQWKPEKGTFDRKYMSFKVFVAEIHLVWLRAGIYDANSQPGGIGKDDHLILKSTMEQLWKKRRSDNLVTRSTVEGRKAGSLARVIDLALVCAPGQRNLHTGTNESTLCAKSKVSYLLHFFTLHSPSWSPGGPPRLPTEQVEVGDTLRSLSSDLACCALQMERWVFTQRQHNASPKMWFFPFTHF